MMKKTDTSQRIRRYYEKYNMDKLFRHSVLEDLKLMEFSRMEYLCREDERMNSLLFFVEGRAKAFRTLANGKSLLVSFYEPFQIMGEVELLEQCNASCNAQAITGCVVLAMDMEVARKKLWEDPVFLRFACRTLSEKLNELGRSSSINLFYPLENRLASYILMTVVSSTKDENARKLVFNENLTHLSELLGTSYRHLLRTLNKFCRQQILYKEEKGYSIMSKEKLEDLAEEFF